MPEGEEREEYVTSMKKTLLSTAFGLALGPICFYMTWDAESQSLMREPFAFFLLLGAVWVQGAVLPHLGVDTEELEAKDWLFIGFMTITFALAVWTLLIPVNPIYR